MQHQRAYRKFEEVLYQVEYKPNWQFELGRSDKIHGEESLKWFIKADMPNSRSPRREIIPIISTGWLSTHLVEDFSEAMILDAIRSSIHSLENHELDEWFKYKGILVSDPH